MKLTPFYSGPLSQNFWDRINRIEDGQRERGMLLRLMGIQLQEIEIDMLKSLACAEENAPKKPRKTKDANRKT